ncbi:hypothetical protein PR202_ga11189 [Eleusine coracana subsp. coracana]|uniref:KIB1-4 beta-propeller domain-containing protein n=1 Tax=Eleusine coracana subsp. coracana TaxID=191504 RepID=A0AAV5C8C8_ELECO|nr:hypothetical protein PR202_ga11189 [Eleusine coracana subsp. coracana]
MSTFLWRPEDGNRIALPSMEKNLPLDCKCILSNKPSSSSCVVMVLDLYGFDYWVCPIGGSEWERHGYSITKYDDAKKELHMARRHGMAAVGGKIYYEITGYELGVVEFDPADAEPTLTSIEVDIPETVPIWSSYLSSSRARSCFSWSSSSRVRTCTRSQRTRSSVSQNNCYGWGLFVSDSTVDGASRRGRGDKGRPAADRGGARAAQGGANVEGGSDELDRARWWSSVSQGRA